MAKKDKGAPEQTEVIQAQDPIPVTMDLPVDALEATITPEQSTIAVGNILAPDDISISAKLWARTDGKLPAHHTSGFVAWADGQNIKAATTKEWRKHFETYRNSRVR